MTAINPRVRAFQSTYGHRYYGLVTLVVPRVLDPEKLRNWIDTALLTRLARGASVRAVFE